MSIKDLTSIAKFLESLCFGMQVLFWNEVDEDRSQKHETSRPPSVDPAPIILSLAKLLIARMHRAVLTDRRRSEAPAQPKDCNSR